MREQKATFCRVCEPFCGLLADVDGDRVVGVRGDRDNPLSRGFVCTKASAMVDITYDADRVVAPLRRSGGPGEFEPVSWDEALGDITDRLRTILDAHGPHAYASFFGNPPAFNAASLIWLDGFQKTIGSRWKYGVNGEDGASMTVASALMFGSPALLPKPDLWRTDFLLMLGANPYVSHGSLITEPRVREALDGILERGGRVVVVDPRRTETARRYEHVGVRPGTDPWLLAALINTMLEKGVTDGSAISQQTVGLERLRSALERFSLDECASRTGLSAEDIEQLAVDLASASSACVYGRTGTCTQRFGTLANFLQMVLNVITGNLERPGGAVFGWAPIDFDRFAHLAGLATYDSIRSRVNGYPEVLGMLPSQGLAADITTPGDDRIRALMTFGANPVLTSGAGGPRLEQALGELDLHFSLDLYVNETNRHADYVLPCTTMYERPDMPLSFMGNMLRPTLYATEAVASPRGEAREEWQILNDIARRLGRGGAYSVAPLRWLSRAGLTLTPTRMYDLLIRTSNVGDWFGLRRSGLSWNKLLKRHPHGVQLRESLPVRPLSKVLRTKDHKVQLAPQAILTELQRLSDTTENADFPLLLIGRRETRSHNTWMHNVERLVPDGRTAVAHVHPDDVRAAGVGDAELLLIESASGSVVLGYEATDDVGRGTVSIPHGWGHAGGWKRANAAGGASSNLLASSRPEDVEALAGMSVLNGVPVRIARAGEGDGSRSKSSQEAADEPTTASPSGEW